MFRFFGIPEVMDLFRIASNIAGLTKKFAWMPNDSDVALVIEAPDYDTAYRIAIAERFKTSDSVEDACAWFSKSDHLVELGETLTTVPYDGDLPDGFDHLD